MGVAHVAFNFGTWCECSNRVDNNYVERTRANQHVCNFESLLTGVWLRDQQLIDVDANSFCIDRVHGVLCVDVGTDATIALRFSNNVHGEC